jgi:gluconolactonase
MEAAFVTRVRGELRRRPRPAPSVEVVAETDAHEGPVYAADEHALYFTSADGTAIKRLDLVTRSVTVVRRADEHANGMTMGRDGRLVACLQGSMTEPARIAAVDRRTGEASTIVDAWRGRALNSPNDVIVAADGAIWFTDPSYGWLQGFRPQPRIVDQVYRFHDGELEVVAGGFVKPNGLALSPDERTLYVGDSETREVWALEGGRRRVLARIADGYPDGLKTDAAGRVYTTCADGIQVFRPDGSLAREIPAPGAVNLAFGRDLLFITTDTAVLAARGA